jgi:undecaprenyl-diphosphatase
MLTPLTKIILLAVVQGVTEFLPISSSGHLVILADWLNQYGETPLEINDVSIVLHVGTLLSIIVFYQRRVWRLLSEDRRLILPLLVGTIPAVALGVPAKLWFESYLESALLAGCFLIVTGIILILVGRLPRGERELNDITLGQSFLIGISQALAILPGLSRSGATISTGMAQQFSPKAAATFSFLLAIPVLVGAGLIEAISLFREGTNSTPLSHLALGMLISFAVGLVSLWALVRVLEHGRLQWFALWCIPLGISVVIWQLLLGAPTI